MILAAWEKLGDKVYQPGSLWQFQAKWGQDISPYIRGIHSDAVLKAIDNLGKILNAKPGTYYFDFRMGLRAFFEKHLDKFLPGNFKPADFRKRLGFADQNEADTAEAMRQVYGDNEPEAETEEVWA